LESLGSLIVEGEEGDLPRESVEDKGRNLRRKKGFCYPEPEVAILSAGELDRLNQEIYRLMKERGWTEDDVHMGGGIHLADIYAITLRRGITNKKCTTHTELSLVEQLTLVFGIMPDVFLKKIRIDGSMLSACAKGASPLSGVETLKDIPLLEISKMVSEENNVYAAGLVPLCRAGLLAIVRNGAGIFLIREAVWRETKDAEYDTIGHFINLLSEGLKEEPVGNSIFTVKRENGTASAGDRFHYTIEIPKSGHRGRGLGSYVGGYCRTMRALDYGVKEFLIDGKYEGSRVMAYFASEQRSNGKSGCRYLISRKLSRDGLRGMEQRLQGPGFEHIYLHDILWREIKSKLAISEGQEAYLDELYSFVKAEYGRDNLIKLSYHCFNHSLETAYLSLLIAVHKGYHAKRILEMAIAGLLHDLDPGRKTGSKPKVVKTVEYLRNNKEISRILRKLRINLDRIIVFVRGTDYPMTDEQGRAIEKYLNLIRYPALRQLTEEQARFLRAADEAATYVILEPKESEIRVRHLGRELGLTEEEILSGTSAFLNILQENKYLREALAILPANLISQWESTKQHFVQFSCASPLAGDTLLIGSENIPQLSQGTSLQEGASPLARENVTVALNRWIGLCDDMLSKLGEGKIPDNLNETLLQLSREISAYAQKVINSKDWKTKIVFTTFSQAASFGPTFKEVDLLSQSGVFMFSDNRSISNIEDIQNIGIVLQNIRKTLMLMLRIIEYGDFPTQEFKFELGEPKTVLDLRWLKEKLLLYDEGLRQLSSGSEISASPLAADPEAYLDLNEILSKPVISGNRAMLKFANPLSKPFAIASNFAGIDIGNPWSVTRFAQAHFINDSGINIREKKLIRHHKEWRLLDKNSAYFQHKYYYGYNRTSDFDKEPELYIIQELQAMGLKKDQVIDIKKDKKGRIALSFVPLGIHDKSEIIFVEDNGVSPSPELNEELAGRLDAVYQKACEVPGLYYHEYLPVINKWIRPRGFLILNPYSEEKGYIDLYPQLCAHFRRRINTAHFLSSQLKSRIGFDISSLQSKSKGHGWAMEVWQKGLTSSSLAPHSRITSYVSRIGDKLLAIGNKPAGASSTMVGDCSLLKEQTKLVRFYFGLMPDHRGRYIYDIWSFNHTQLEEVHDYIQLLFPTEELNWTFGFYIANVEDDKIITPIMDEEGRKAFNGPSECSFALRQNMLASFDLSVEANDVPVLAHGRTASSLDNPEKRSLALAQLAEIMENVKRLNNKRRKATIYFEDGVLRMGEEYYGHLTELDSKETLYRQPDKEKRTFRRLIQSAQENMKLNPVRLNGQNVLIVGPTAPHLEAHLALETFPEVANITILNTSPESIHKTLEDILLKWPEGLMPKVKIVIADIRQPDLFSVGRFALIN